MPYQYTCYGLCRLCNVYNFDVMMYQVDRRFVKLESDGE